MAVTSTVMTAQELREAERRTMETVDESSLMDRAAAAVVRECATLVRDGAAVVVLAGSGNNGGDALLAGAELARRGWPVIAVTLGGARHERGARLLGEAGGTFVDGADAVPAQALAHTDLVIDGIVGLGAAAGLREPWLTLASEISPAATVVAVDLPSGLEADSPTADAPHLPADVTVTFTAPKRCLVEHPAAASAGRVVVADVGVEL